MIWKWWKKSKYHYSTCISSIVSIWFHIKNFQLTFLPYFPYLITLTYFSSIFSISFHNFLLYFPNFFTIQLTFLSSFPYHFTSQLTFLPYCPYLITIRLDFLPYFPYLFTIQLTFLPYFPNQHMETIEEMQVE
jgi:hypothetical protein